MTEPSFPIVLQLASDQQALMELTGDLLTGRLAYIAPDGTISYREANPEFEVFKLFELWPVPVPGGGGWSGGVQAGWNVRDAVVEACPSGYRVVVAYAWVNRVSSHQYPTGYAALYHGPEDPADADALAGSVGAVR